MGVEYGFGKAAGLKQAEAQKHGISHSRPDGGADIGGQGDVLHQNGIDRHADDDEKGLKCQRGLTLKR